VLFRSNGIVRIVEFTSQTSVEAEVLSTLGRAASTTLWEEGEWSGYRGFPSAVAFHDGRLYWGFQDRLMGSVPDDFTNFDDTTEGDSGPINRSVATGGAEAIRWLLSAQRLLVGTVAQEVSVRSNSFDEPITPTAFTARKFSSRGCADLQAIRIDSRGIFVGRDENRVYEMVYEINAQDYDSRDATRLNPEICGAGIVDLAIQRLPDTRVWFVLADGTAAVLTYEPSDEVIAWTTVSTAGDIKAVGVLPGDDEDEVYFAVERVNSGATIMAIEKLARLSQVEGGNVSRNMDSFVTFTGLGSDTISGLDHLEGLEVVAWADGIPYPGPYTVSGGDIVLEDTVDDGCAGLAYDGLFKSTKLTYAGGDKGTSLGQQKRVDHLSLIMTDVGWKGVEIGRDFDNMTGLNPTRDNAGTLADTDVISDVDFVPVPFDGGWKADPRFCFRVSAPYPATFLGVVVSLTTGSMAEEAMRRSGGDRR